MIWIGLAIGCPFIGKCSEKYKRRRIFFIICSLLGVLSSLVILFSNITNKYYFILLFFLLGFSGSGASLSFAVITENAPKKLRATALGMNNTFIMGVASILPPLMTIIIRYYSKGNEITLYAFEKGLNVIPVCFFISLIISIIGTKETFCRQQRELHILKKRKSNLFKNITRYPNVIR